MHTAVYNTSSGCTHIGLGDRLPYTGYQPDKCYILAVTQGMRALPDIYA